MTRSTSVANLVVLGLMPIAVHAGPVTDRPTLQGILGANGVLEDFETLVIPSAGQRMDSSGFLNSDSIFDGSGPGLVQPGATYKSPRLWWNGDNYYGLNTQTLGDSTSWRGEPITVDYTTAVSAMGFDMQGYGSFKMEGIVTVYDTNNVPIGAASVNGGFFGWEHAGGIGSVVIEATINSHYIMIDNHLYGTPVPGPSAIALFSVLGLTAGSRRRRI